MFAQVVIDISGIRNIDFFEYEVPADLDVQVGQRVIVPFANKMVEGIVFKLKNNFEYNKNKIKKIYAVKEDFPVITELQFKIAVYLKQYYRISFPAAIRFLIPSCLRDKNISSHLKKYIKLNDCCNDPVEILKTKNGNFRSKAQYDMVVLLTESGGTVEYKHEYYAAAKALEKKGIVELIYKKVCRNPVIRQKREYPSFKLNKYQNDILNEISSSESDRFLLHGVTGSGKTEIYVNLIRETLNKGKTVLYLVPEISLIPQTFNYLFNRLNEDIAVVNSGLSDGERIDQWLKILKNETRIVLGTRSCLFSPVNNLGLIIIDEEHSLSYKSESYPKYDARDIADFLQHQTGALMILGSATPSLITYYRALHGEYHLLELKNRVNNLDMPEVNVVNMQDEYKNGNVSPFSNELLTEMQNTINNKKQIVLFINRRGYSNYLMCKICGHVLKCDTCSVSLTYHKDNNCLKCHYCGKVYEYPEKCPECGSEYLKNIGIGTQKIEELLFSFLDGASVIRMDLDSVSHKGAYERIYNSFINNNTNILIGTQMVTKGLDFPDVELSVIADADALINFPDYRSCEIAFTQIMQIAGRSGRSGHGKVFIQTVNPDHYVIKTSALHNYGQFYNTEIEIRKTANMPPFVNLITFQFSGKKDTECVDAVKLFLNKLHEVKGLNKILVNIDAHRSLINRINDYYYYEIILSLKKETNNDTIESIKELYADFNYGNVLVGFDIE